MKTISVSVSEEDYEEFRRIAKVEGRSIAQLIREAMTLHREAMVKRRPRLTQLPTLIGHRLIADLPNRADVYDEIAAHEDVSK